MGLRDALVPALALSPDCPTERASGERARYYSGSTRSGSGS